MLMYLKCSNLNSIHWIIKKKISAFMYFSGHFMTIFRSNYFHLIFFLISFLIFVKHMPIYLTFSNLNSIHWIIKKIYRPLCTFQDIFRAFHDNFSGQIIFTGTRIPDPPFSSFIPSHDYGMDLCLEVYL